jgi:YaiO family outer membrane protein
MYVKQPFVIGRHMTRQLLKFIFLAAPYLFLVQVSAQNDGRYNLLSDEALFIRARELAFSGESEKALDAATHLFARNPSHLDAAVLIARLYAWQDDYDSSRIYISHVLINDPCHHDAMAASVDVEIWDGKYDRALEKAKLALSCHPDDESFLFAQSLAYYHQGNRKAANEILQYLKELNPGNEDALRLERLMSAPGFYHYRENDFLLAGYHGEFYEEPASRHMHIGTAGYSYYTGRGPLTGKINFGNVYIDGTGMTRYPSLQFEVESYPLISAKTYLLLNYAFSEGTIFPGHRGAFEIFRKLPAGFEASLGMRVMQWDDTYLFYSGYLGKYHADLWFSLRTYVFPGDQGVASSWYFNARKYFRTADDYAGIIAGFGLLPDETLSELTDRMYLNSTSLGIELSKGLGHSYLLRTSLRYEEEEYTVHSFRSRWTFNVGLRYYL